MAFARRRSLASTLRLVASIVLIAAAVYALSRRWGDVRTAARSMELSSAGYALVAVACGSFCSFLSWKSVMSGLGASVSVPAGLRVYFVGQLAKYVPGSIWQPLTQMELGRDHGIARRVTVVSSAVALLIVVGTGILVAIVCAPFVGAGALSRYLWIVPALPLVVVMLYPPFLNRAVSFGMRIVRREAMPRPLSGRAVASASAWALAVWGIYGVQTWVLARSVDGDAGHLFALATAAFAVAWVVGFLVVIAPAGAVAREAALVVLLHRTMPIAEATTVAVVSRVLFTITDLGWGLAGALLGLKNNEPKVTDARREPG